MKKFLSQAGVTLIGGSVEEMPLAYKDIEKVMPAQESLVDPRQVHTPDSKNE